ncbi:DUF397 domain-containing protein [Kitasatospora sp. NPDC097605]|uniref:DUF397 domain-containing protein n=1 Tax=Kitasatospora sp. NPDC097605 TaxID=3157226 RepID=UPI00333146E0
MSARPVWFKSSHSGNEGGDCVEVWFKSSYSSNEGGDCVEVAEVADEVRVRDSKDKSGPQLAFSPAAWRSFVEFTQTI